MATRKKTVLRTIRIPVELAELLERDAGTKRMSVNALVVAILTKYSEWDRLAEKFGFITFTRQGFRRLLDAADEDKLNEISRELGSRQAREVILFWFGKVTVETFLAYVSAFSRYGGLAEIEVKSEGPEYTITGHHDLGERWSNVLRHFLGEAMRDTLGIEPRFHISKTSLVVRFSTLGR